MKSWFPVWMIPVLIVFSFTTVWLRLSIVQTTYELNEKNKVLNNLKLNHERLALKVAQLRSPRHLEMLSKQKFKLIPPAADQIIRVKE